MSLTPRLTLIGLYKFNSDVFSNLILPDAVNRETFIDSLLLEYGECPLIYPDYDFMVLAVGAWSRKWYANIERIATAITQEYNPLYNYDRTENWTENESGNKDFTREVAKEQKQNVRENINVNETGNEEINKNENGNDEYLVSAYNEDDYQPSEKRMYENEANTINENEKETESSRTLTNNDNDNTDETYNENNGRKNVKNGRVYGNIGVTESTTMLQHEIDIRRSENLYHIIAELFYKEFCLYVF